MTKRAEQPLRQGNLVEDINIALQIDATIGRTIDALDLLKMEILLDTGGSQGNVIRRYTPTGQLRSASRLTELRIGVILLTQRIQKRAASASNREIT